MVRENCKMLLKDSDIPIEGITGSLYIKGIQKMLSQSQVIPDEGIYLSKMCMFFVGFCFFTEMY